MGIMENIDHENILYELISFGMITPVKVKPYKNSLDTDTDHSGDFCHCVTRSSFCNSMIIGYWQKTRGKNTCWFTVTSKSYLINVQNLHALLYKRRSDMGAKSRIRNVHWNIRECDRKTMDMTESMGLLTPALAHHYSFGEIWQVTLQMADIGPNFPITNHSHQPFMRLYVNKRCDM